VDSGVRAKKPLAEKAAQAGGLFEYRSPDQRFCCASATAPSISVVTARSPIFFQMGRVEEARKSLAAVRLEQPQLSVDWIKSSVPYQTPELMEQFLTGLRKAGLT
jgi:hypothetical protein